MQKNLEDRDLVLDGLEKGTEAQLRGEDCPLFPLTVTGGGAASRDALLDVFRRSAEVMVESIDGRTGTSFQGIFCGKEVLR